MVLRPCSLGSEQLVLRRLTRGQVRFLGCERWHLGVLYPVSTQPGVKPWASCHAQACTRPLAAAPAPALEGCACTRGQPPASAGRGPARCWARWQRRHRLGPAAGSSAPTGLRRHVGGNLGAGSPCSGGFHTSGNHTVKSEPENRSALLALTSLPADGDSAALCPGIGTQRSRGGRRPVRAREHPRHVHHSREAG